MDKRFLIAGGAVLAFLGIINVFGKDLPVEPVEETEAEPTLFDKLQAKGIVLDLGSWEAVKDNEWDIVNNMAFPYRMWLESKHDAEFTQNPAVIEDMRDEEYLHLLLATLPDILRNIEDDHGSHRRYARIIKCESKLGDGVVYLSDGTAACGIGEILAYRIIRFMTTHGAMDTIRCIVSCNEMLSIDDKLARSLATYIQAALDVSRPTLNEMIWNALPNYFVP